MADISDKIAELAKDGEGEETERLAGIIRDRLPRFVMECEEELKTPLQRGIARVKRMDAADRPLN